jgi:hypothetical protein
LYFRWIARRTWERKHLDQLTIRTVL